MGLKFSIITLFPEVFGPYIKSSILKRAQKKGLVEVSVIDIRDFTSDKHKRADDRPYGGGPGMVLKAPPILRAVKSAIKKSKIKNEKLKIILLSAAGKQFTSKMAQRFSREYKHIVLIAGHYEGIDERVAKILKTIDHKLETISIGPYVLTGGELAAMAIVDAITRQVPGVLGRQESLEERRFGVGVPVFTRPEVLDYGGKKYRVPRVLLSGDHKKIAEWRKKHKKK